uniref:C2H2-type domain-containing protein n=1 Tax=Cacopsylla melanoneura TaxID=428564 RepID=A0A8D8X7L9_9HEMI
MKSFTQLQVNERSRDSANEVFENETLQGYGLNRLNNKQETYDHDDIYTNFDEENNSNEIRKQDMVCQFCNISFSNRKQCNYHMETHYNIKDKNRYNCDVCGINYRTKYEMKEHKRTHFYKYDKNKKVKFGRKKNKNYERYINQDSRIDSHSKEQLNKRDNFDYEKDEDIKEFRQM